MCLRVHGGAHVAKDLSSADIDEPVGKLDLCEARLLQKLLLFLRGRVRVVQVVEQPVVEDIDSVFWEVRATARAARRHREGQPRRGRRRRVGRSGCERRRVEGRRRRKRRRRDGISTARPRRRRRQGRQNRRRRKRAQRRRRRPRAPVPGLHKIAKKRAQRRQAHRRRPASGYYRVHLLVHTRSPFYSPARSRSARTAAAAAIPTAHPSLQENTPYNVNRTANPASLCTSLLPQLRTRTSKRPARPLGVGLPMPGFGQHCLACQCLTTMYGLPISEILLIYFVISSYLPSRSKHGRALRPSLSQKELSPDMAMCFGSDTRNLPCGGRAEAPQTHIIAGQVLGTADLGWQFPRVVGAAGDLWITGTGLVIKL